MRNYKLKILRKEINKIDFKLAKLLEKRIKLVDEINYLKDKLNLPLTSKKREKEIINNLSSIVKDVFLKDFLIDIYENIFEISKKRRRLKNCKINFSKIGIIGLGLIGGSIAKTLKFIDKKIKIFGLKEKDKDAKKAYKEKIIDEVCSLSQIIKNSELIILSVPIELIVEISKKIEKIEKEVKDKVLVIDTGSVKKNIVEEFERLSNEKIEFLGTHPMAGSHKTGFENSKVGLFLNHPWIITPHKKNKNISINKIYNFVKNLGSKPFILPPEKHDKIVAFVSHLNYLLVLSFFAYIYENNKDYLKYAGTGFKTTTRLVNSNPFMWKQIFLNNYDNITRGKKEFIKFLKEFKLEKDNFLKITKKYKKINSTLFNL